MIKFFWVWEDVNMVQLDEKLDTNKLPSEDIWQLALDILETEYDIVILSPIAGIDLDDIDLSFAKSVLIIKWIRKRPDIFESEVTVRNSECYWWAFIRNVILPENLDFDSIEATMENNLLIITIKKLQFSSQNIKINRTI